MNSLLEKTSISWLLSVTSILVIQIEPADHAVLNLKANVVMASMEKYFFYQRFPL